MGQQMELRPASYTSIFLMGPGEEAKFYRGSQYSSQVNLGMWPIVEQEGALSSRSSGQLDDLKAGVRQREVILGGEKKNKHQWTHKAIV